MRRIGFVAAALSALVVLLGSDLRVVPAWPGAALFPPTTYTVSGFDDAAIEAEIASCQTDDPVGGCAFVLPAGTYLDVQVEWPPQARTVSGAGQGQTIVRGPVDPGTAPIFLREPRDGGYPTSFYDLSIDGRKQDFPSGATVGDHHNCIRFDDPTSAILKGGEIKRVTCENVAHEGFQLYQVHDYVVEGNTLRYLGCWDETGSGEDPWEPLGGDAALVRCGAWGALQPDELQTGRKTNGIGIEIGNFARGNIVRGNLVEVTTKIGIQTVTFLGDVEENYALGTHIVANTVRHTPNGGIVNEYGNHGLIERNTIEDTHAPWQSGDTGKGIACSTGGRRTRIRDNSISRTGGAGIDAGCSCGINTSSSDPACFVSVTGNTINDTCRIFTATSAIDADAKGWSDPDPTAHGITITGNPVTNDGCAQSTTFDGFSGVTTDLASSPTFTVTEPLITTEAALDRVLATVPASMISDHGTATSVAARSLAAQTFDYDLPQEPWEALTGPNRCVPTVATGGTYDLTAASQQIFNLAYDFRVNGDTTAGNEAHDQLLNFAGGSGYSAGTLSRANQCPLDISEAIPNLVNAALLLESGGLPAWTIDDRVTLADWVISVFPLVSWAAENNGNNWGAVGMRAAHAAAAFVAGYASSLTLWDASTITPAAYYSTRIPGTVWTAFLAGGQDTCFDDPSEPTGMQTSGALPEEMRRSPEPSGLVANCSEISIDFACAGDTGPPYDTLGDCDGDTGAAFYQGKAIQALAALAEEHLNLTGSSALWDDVSHGGANEAIYDGLLMATTLASGSLGFFQDVYARDGVVGGFLLAAEYYDDGCMANVLRDSTADPFTDLRGGNDLPWMSILAYPGVRDTSPALACAGGGGGDFVSWDDPAIPASVQAVESRLPYAYYVPEKDLTSGWTFYDVTCEEGDGGCTPAPGTSRFPSAWGCDPMVADRTNGSPTDNGASLRCMWWTGGSYRSDDSAESPFVLYFPEDGDNHYGMGPGGGTENNSIMRPDPWSDNRGIVCESTDVHVGTFNIDDAATSQVNLLDTEGSTVGSAQSWSGAARGATVLTGIASTSGFATGDWLQITATAGAELGNNSAHYLAKIASVDSASQVTIDRPLPIDFDNGGASLQEYAMVENLVFRDCTFDMKYPEHQQGGLNWVMNLQRVVESELSGSVIHGYQSPVLWSNAARNRIAGNDYQSEWDKPWNSYLASNDRHHDYFMVNNHLKNMPQGFSCNAGNGGWVGFNHWAPVEANASADTSCDSDFGGGNDCTTADPTGAVYLSHSGAHGATVAGTNAGGGTAHFHCNSNDVDDASGMGSGITSCGGTRSGVNSGSVTLHGPTCSNTSFVHNYLGAGIWMDGDSGPGWNHFFNGNVLRDEGTTSHIKIGGDGGNWVLVTDTGTGGYDAGFRFNPVILNTVMNNFGSSGVAFDAGMDGAEILYSLIQGTCHYNGGSTPDSTLDAACTSGAGNGGFPVPENPSIGWDNVTVNAATPSWSAVLPSADPHITEEQILGEFDDTTGFPWIGADQGAEGGTSADCLPARKRHNGGSC